VVKTLIAIFIIVILMILGTKLDNRIEARNQAAEATRVAALERAARSSKVECYALFSGVYIPETLQELGFDPPHPCDRVALQQAARQLGYSPGFTYNTIIILKGFPSQLAADQGARLSCSDGRYSYSSANYQPEPNLDLSVIMDSVVASEGAPLSQIYCKILVSDNRVIRTIRIDRN
jgi:hypothetical protein